MEGGPTFQTQVTKTNGGYRFANSNWEYALWHVRIRFVNYSALMQKIVGFWLARKGPARGFIIEDPFDHDDNGWGKVALVSGSYRLVKEYPDDVAPYKRLITRPKTGTVTLTGVAKSGGGTCTESDVDLTTGIIANATSTGTATYEFEIPVAFTSDGLKFNYQVGDVAEMAELEAEELRV
jgi:uncharacterized protein (TIGR02217 family)